YTNRGIDRFGTPHAGASSHKLSPRMSDRVDGLGPDAIESLLRAVFAMSRDPVGVSQHGRMRVANPAFVRLYGYRDESELVGRSIFDLIAPSSREMVTELVRRRAAGEETPAVYLATALRADGSELAIEVRSTPCELQDERYSLAFVREAS